jgi:hypothetical protein
MNEMPEARWSPPSGLLTHADKPIPPEADFFVPPPPALGPLVSAQTSLTEDVQPRSPGQRFSIATLAGLLGCLAGLLVILIAGIQSGFWRTFWLVATWGIGALIALGATRFRHTCSYVGRLGVARFSCAGGRELLTRERVFLFQDARELRTSQTRNYLNGIYQGTQYEFNWTDEDGQKVFRLAGTHRGEKKLPKSTDPFHFALATELAWSVYLLDLAQEELDRNGFVHFNVGGRSWVRVGPGFLDLSIKDQQLRCRVEEIGEIFLGDGTFTVKHKDARKGFLGFGSSGIFSFQYGSMANAKLFLLALDRLLGLRFD